MKNPHALGRDISWLSAVLVLAALLAFTTACGSPENTPTIEVSPTSLPTSTPTEIVSDADNVRWLLQALDGHPLIGGTFITLRLNRDGLGGFDGCNTFSGRHEDGATVAAKDGTFAMPSGIASTAQGCQDPKASWTRQTPT